jgi:hypothetical protein
MFVSVFFCFSFFLLDFHYLTFGLSSLSLSLHFYFLNNFKYLNFQFSLFSGTAGPRKGDLPGAEADRPGKPLPDHDRRRQVRILNFLTPL